MKTTKFFTAIVLIGTLAATLWFWQQQQQGDRESLTVNDSELPVALEPAVVKLIDGDTYDLTAGFVKKEIAGKEYRMLAYTGSIPGPLLTVPQGSTITVNLKNETSIPTTLHSHGVRLENEFDGVPEVTQPLVQPGASFVYRITFADAGMYWYHPHFREDYAQELGLYGNYLVMPEKQDYWNPVNREVPLVLDDLLIENSEIRLSAVQANRTLMGRYGNVMLVNGETEYELAAKQGEVIRFYLTNAANARPFRIAIAGARMKLVGADAGAYLRETWVEDVTIGPSERAIIEVLFAQPGRYTLENRTPLGTTALGTIAVESESVETSYAEAFALLSQHPEVIANVTSLSEHMARPPDKQLTLSLDMGTEMMRMMQGTSHGGGHTVHGGAFAPSEDGIEWEDTNPMMNVMSTSEMMQWKIVDAETGKKNMDIDWEFTKGDFVKIRIVNGGDSLHPMQHPVHFHGQRFLVLARNGAAEDNPAWKDTVLIPAGETTDILVEMSNLGEWMAHCHIAEHLEAGMMFTFKVTNAS